MITLKNVLVATDFSRTADATLACGHTLAGSSGVAARAARGGRGPSDRRRRGIQDLADLQRGWSKTRALNSMSACSRAREGKARARDTSKSPARAIVDYANSERIDLIVVGTEGRGGVSRLVLGSVAERVVRTAPCPVLTVHHPEREFVRPDEPKPAAARA